jgi:hypothetical protein
MLKDCFQFGIRRDTWNRLLPRIIGALLAVSGFMLGAVGSRAQISPGPLSNAHQSVSASSTCTSCHQFGAAKPTYKCLDCHKEINQLLTAGHGYHAQLKMSDPTSKDCVRCHREHNGADFQLVHWDKPIRQFNHAQAGYVLQGKHANLGCEKCHTPAHMDLAEKSLIQRADLAKSYLGLSQNCVTCHQDPHKGDLGPDCQRCHNFVDWKQASQFDHSKTKYPLTGLHSKVSCEKCHVPAGPSHTAQFTGLKFGACVDCHTDPHRGEFKTTCESCHNTSGWQNVTMSDEFDHSKTKFPLLGAHIKVGCDSCHVGGDFHKAIAFGLCDDCHKPDPHKGQFLLRASKGECAECHTVNAWKPSLFGVKEHAVTAYPLLGKHTDVECAKCHKPAGADTLFKVKFGQCQDCHQDAHNGQFAKAPFLNRCESCHTVIDFRRSRFTIAMHKTTRFPLEGAHAVIPCIECHKAGAEGRVDTKLSFHFEDQSCAACHMDPHHGEFKDRMAEKGANGSALGCEACHNVRTWIDAKGFDHSKTSFPLIGAHRATACRSCHVVQAGTHTAVFKGTSTKCEDCHMDVHAGQFDKNTKTHCDDCHTPERWVPSTFDHDRRTSLPLTGGHALVSCDKCHKQSQLFGDKSVVVYSLAPTKCSECHGTPDSTFAPRK